MHFHTRAFISIKRNLTKSVTLFILILALGSMISGTVFVNKAITDTKHNITADIQPSAVIGFDWLAMQEHDVEREVQGYLALAEPEPPSLELIQEIGALPYVKHYEYIITGLFFGSSLRRYRDISYDFLGDLGPQLRVQGVHYSSFLELEKNIIEIIAGRTFTEDEINYLSTVALVSDLFAELNQLTIGSVISLKNVVFEPTKVMFFPDFHEKNTIASENYEVEIIGIFRVNLVEDGMTRISPSDFDELKSLLVNQIYAPHNLVEIAHQFSMKISADITLEIDTDDPIEANNLRLSHRNFRENNRMRVESFFTLHDPRDIISFQETANKLLPEFYTMAVVVGNYPETIRALDMVNSLSMMILFLIIGAAIFVLNLLVILFLRDRKHEIGIYLSLGESRYKIVMQVIIEVFSVAVIAFFVTLFIGHLIAGYMTEHLMIRHLLAEVEREEFLIFNPAFRRGFYTEITTDTIKTSYNISLTPLTMLIFFCIGIGTTLLSTILPILSIVRLNPKKVMMWN